MNKEIKIGNILLHLRIVIFIIKHCDNYNFCSSNYLLCSAFFRVATGGIAGGNVNNIPFEECKRRLYAIELWISASGLAVYLAVIYKKKFRNPLTCEKASEKEDNTAE